MATEKTATEQDDGEDATGSTGGTAVARREGDAVKPSRVGAKTTRARDGEGPGGLESSTGSTSIADTVVTKVVGLAAREVPGVYDLGGGAARTIGTLTHMVGLGDQNSQGVSVEVGETEAAADLTVVIEYGESIPKVAQLIRERVVARVEGITGLKVTEVNIEVNDLHFPGDDEQDDEQPRVQ
jgi:uncharacterized alkaline shock family protein YloU